MRPHGITPAPGGTEAADRYQFFAGGTGRRYNVASREQAVSHVEDEVVEVVAGLSFTGASFTGAGGGLGCARAAGVAPFAERGRGGGGVADLWGSGGQARGGGG